MQPRSLFIFAGLAAVAGVALAARRDAAPRIDAPDGEGAAWWPDPLDAVDQVEGMFVMQQGLSTSGLQLLKSPAFEGFSSTPYPDHKGYSIGYGHLIKPGENLTYVTPAQAEQLLLQDVAWAERAVRTAVTVPLTQSQFDALVLFAYNVGEGAFKRSTLVKKLNAGDQAGAAAEFPRWVYASGQVSDALVARRANERSLFEA